MNAIDLNTKQLKNSEVSSLRNLFLLVEAVATVNNDEYAALTEIDTNYYKQPEAILCE